MNEAQQRWPGFQYEQVRGLANRHISRYLRTQRKNMRRLFEERGYFDLVDRMNQIRDSRQGMLAKNLMFQQVLNEYSQLVNSTVSEQSRPIGVGAVPGSVLHEPAPAYAAAGQATNPQAPRD